MIQDAVENMPSWLKAGIAIGVGITAGVLIAKIVLVLGT